MSPERRRLHPAGILVYALATLREAAIPLLAVFLVGGLGGGFDERALLRGVGFAAAGAVFAAAAGYLRWHTTTWWVSEEGIHRRSGLVSIKETDVPLGRIQSLDVEQGPLQRAFAVHSLHVQTGGGGAKGEIVLEALARADVERLRELAAARRSPVAAPEPGLERRLGRRGLLVAALTAGQLGVLLPVLAAAGQLGQSLFDEQRGSEAIGLLPDAASEWALAAAVLLAVAWLLSMLGSIVAFAGFRVSREGDRLRIRRGLLARREATVPVVRVRAVEVVEGLLRRPLGLAALRMEVIGHAEEAAPAKTLFPLLALRDVRAFLDELLPELADDLDRLEPPPRRARRRYLLPPLVLAALVGAPLWAFAGAGPWPLAVALAAAAGYGAAQFRAAGWRLEDGRLATRALRVARITVLAPAARRESHSIGQTPLQRRGDLADLEVAFGKQTSARVRHLDAATAAALWERIAR
jgi:putative membrane protein